MPVMTGGRVMTVMTGGRVMTVMTGGRRRHRRNVNKKLKN